jgi:hypothetical protein
MINQELVFYIKEQLRLGSSRDEIRQTLEREGGWVASDIEEAFKFIVNPVGPAKTEQVIVNTEKDKIQTEQVVTQKVSEQKAETEPQTTSSPFLNSLSQKAPAPAPVADVSPIVRPEPVKQPEKVETPKIDEPKILFEKVVPSNVKKDIPATQDVVKSTASQVVSASNFNTKPTPKFSGMQANSMLEKARPKTHSFGKILGSVFLLIILAGVGVGGVFAYNNYIQPSTSTVFSGILSGVLNSNAFKFTLKSDYSSGADASMTGTLDVEGLATKTIDSYNTHIKVNSTSSISPESVSFEIMKIGTDTYLKLPSIISSFLTSTSMGVSDVDLEKWLHFGQSDISSASSELGGVLPGVNSEEVLAKANALPNKVFQMFSDNQFLSLGKTLKIETKNGEPLRAYELVFNENKFKTFIQELMLEVSGEKELTETMKNELNESIGSISVSSGEVWVGTFSHKLHKLSFKLDRTVSGVTDSINFDLNIDGYNVSDLLTRPMETFEFGEFLNKYKLDQNINFIEQSFSQIKIRAEVYYSSKKTFKDFCTDSNSISSSLSQIFEITGVNPNCTSSIKGYIITSPIPGEEGSYICTDQKGQVVKISGIPTGALCE